MYTFFYIFVKKISHNVIASDHRKFDMVEDHDGVTRSLTKV